MVLVPLCISKIISEITIRTETQAAQANDIKLILYHCVYYVQFELLGDGKNEYFRQITDWTAFKWFVKHCEFYDIC